MLPQIYNTASLTFEYGSEKGYASSNMTTSTLEEIINISKITLDKTYNENSEIISIITVNNNNTDMIRDLKIIDNLGTYVFNQGFFDKKLTPLNYVGPSFLYTGGNFSSQIEPIINIDKLIFNINNIPAKSNINIIYRISTNEYAPLDTKSKITSITTLESNILTKNLSTTTDITVKEHADLSIVKNMTPNTIIPGEQVTYNFSLYNYGNIEAKNVILSDKFMPEPQNINIYINSSQLIKNDFSYINGMLVIPAETSNLNITVPPAKFTQDNSGIISVEPGITNISVTGKILKY